jgi:SAM-dependent methyltransferase
METSIWSYIVIIFAMLSFFTFLFKNKLYNFGHEGFSQNEPFVLKRGDDIYDEFYTSIYDTIHLPHRRVPYELKTIIDATQADEKNSVFLDIGSGTGRVVRELNDLGYTSFGIDKSEAMVKHCISSSQATEKGASPLNSENLDSFGGGSAEAKNENSVFKQGDVEDILLFNKSIFTHITCLYFTIYNFKNKGIFFRNCYQWLKPGGYLIIHLVEKDKFDTVPPIGNNLLFGSPQKNSKTRITTHSVDMPNFKYKLSYDFNFSTFHSEKFIFGFGRASTKTVNFPSQATENSFSSALRSDEKINKNDSLLIETFEDSVTKNIRQNERILYMEPMDYILNIAINAGFVPNANFSYAENIRHSFKPFGLENVTGDPHQFLYILERPIS